MLLSVNVHACSCEPEVKGDGDAGTSDAGPDGNPFDSTFPDVIFTQPDATATGDLCGDSVRGITEACDDGNFQPGDGCSANCRTIEAGYRCPTVGALCIAKTCGDRRIDAPETCDDGNMAPGDGCSASCQVEGDGWTCLPVGAACRAAECGDGFIRGTETCEDDDATPTSGDGCSATCQLEIGFQCLTPGAACTTTTCGNGVLEGLEQCEDCSGDPQGYIRAGETCAGGSTHGKTPYDGCAPDCTLEPACAGGTCTAVCGDGVILPGSGEACDDGNLRGGDGCSSTCTVENGYMCSTMELPAPSSISLPRILRDFRGRDLSPNQHTDFQLNPDGGFLQGMVATTLVNKKPVRSGNYTSDQAAGHHSYPDSDASFLQWYTNDPSVNRVVYDSISLNRTGGTYLFSPGGSDLGENYFPLDGKGFNIGGMSPENEAGRDGGHNFHFTTEVHYWFEYNGTERLRFVGDDDLWVFVDGRLCLDLGGQHGKLSGIMNFQNPAEQDTANATDQNAVVTACKTYLDGRRDLLRMTTNNPTANPVFEMIIFNAERHTSESNFLLTLGNFVKRQSVCSSVCGDPYVTSNEVCDLGAGNNNGGYNGCLNCTALGPYCGDENTDTAFQETCDDGTNGDVYGGAGCSPECREPPSCGDGVRQQEFEECDAGDQNGIEGSFCTVDCKLTIRID